MQGVKLNSDKIAAILAKSKESKETAKKVAAKEAVEKVESKNIQEPIYNDQVYVIKEKLAMLDDSLKENLPNMATILRDIHTQLKDDPDTVTLLSEEECNILVEGLKAKTQTVIATAALKSSKAKKALKKTTLEDLM